MSAIPARPMTQPELDLICEVWSDAGCHDSTGSWLWLWEGGDVDAHPEQRDAILAIARECGLDAKVADGMLHLPLTEQLDAEITEHYV